MKRKDKVMKTYINNFAFTYRFYYYFYFMFSKVRAICDAEKNVYA